MSVFCASFTVVLYDARGAEPIIYGFKLYKYRFH